MIGLLLQKMFLKEHLVIHPDSYYEEDGEPRQFDYDDLFNCPDKVFKHFVYEYEQNN